MTDARIRITRVVNASELNAQIEPKMRSLGQAIGARAQRLVPKRSFALNDSIATDTEVRGGKIVTTVGAGGGDVDYAMHVERGTSRAMAQPYLRPALLQTRGADLNYRGVGIETRGVRRERQRSARAARAAQRRSDAAENRNES